ncbi:MAG: hypothetical protein Fur002_17960 [Anaerolineales bacterium]
MLKDKVVLITGAGKGAGRALAEACAARGMRVAANDITPVNVDEVVASILARGGQAKAYVEDGSKKVSAQALVNMVEEDFGGIDALICHAEAQPRAALLDIDEWDWHRALDVNVTAAFLVMQSAARVMRTRGGGKMILLAAGASTREEKGAAYLTGKASLAALANLAGEEFSPLGIDVRAMPHSPNLVNDALRFLEAE